MIAFAIAAVTSGLHTVEEQPLEEDGPKPAYYMEDTNESDYQEAHSAVTLMLQEGKTDGACRSLSKATIKSIAETVKGMQKAIDAAPTGSQCNKDAQGVLNKFKTAKKNAEKAYISAKQNRDRICNAEVDFKPRNLKSIKGDWWQTASEYLTAVKKCDKAKKNVMKMQAKAREAGKALRTGNMVAYKTKRNCMCKAQKEYKKNKKALDSYIKESPAAWTRSQRMLCVLDGKSAKKCKVPRHPLPVMTTKLTKEASSAKCGSKAKDEKCVRWVTQKPSELGRRCSRSCGQRAKTLNGRVMCVSCLATKVSEAKCSQWDGKRPSNPTKHCPRTANCARWATRPAGGCSSACGRGPETKRGSVYCRDDVTGASVSTSRCNKQPKPSNPTRHCPATLGCARWQANGPPGCNSGCKQPAYNAYGQVLCVKTANGQETSPARCAGQLRPGVPQRYCAAGSRLCPGDSCWWGYNRWNTCDGCPGGNHYCFTCSGTRQCNRL